MALFGTLFVLPTTLGGESITDVIPEFVLAQTKQLTHFVVENVRTARRYLSRLGMPVPITDLHFEELNEHTSFQEVPKLLVPLLNGISVGLISEAGVPAMADPGASLVALAHAKGVKVVPLTGPSSIVLALMGSGLNGQNFAFVGYLPIKEDARARRIKQLEQRSKIEKQAQFFIETPYRNNKLMESMLSTLHPQTLLHVSTDLTMQTEFICTKTVGEWRNSKMPNLHKRPSIFGIQVL
jgi:16S rRNA (cytidine1402-2'-O)-methyltransferase